MTQMTGDILGDRKNKYNNDIKTAEKKYYYNRLILQNNKNKKT